MPSTLSLNLWKKQLEHIPDSVWQQTEIETLVLADNQLSELSGLIGVIFASSSYCVCG